MKPMLIINFLFIALALLAAMTSINWPILTVFWALIFVSALNTLDPKIKYGNKYSSWVAFFLQIIQCSLVIYSGFVYTGLIFIAFSIYRRVKGVLEK